MTKFFFSLIIIFISVFSSPADAFRLEGNPYFPPPNIEIIWKATNHWPQSLWIYKTIPQNFSPAVVSNLMAIGGFSWKNLTKRLDPYIEDKNLFRFVNKKQDWTSYVEVAPTFGWIEYYADDTNNSIKLPEDVPGKAETERLASDVLFQLGVDRSLLCNERIGYEAVGGKLSSDGQRLTTNIYNRGISYSRKIDGVESQNSACFIAHFGSHAQITHFWLNWRNLLPAEAHPTLSSGQIIEAIRAGKSVPLFWENLQDMEQAKKITIIKATPYYYEKDPMKPLDFTYPYLKIELSVDFGTNTAPFYLECPILSTNAITIGTQIR
jgi:hypothetical protein